MTRFLYIADNHWGARPMTFQQQPGSPEQLARILDALCAQHAMLDGIDFILHGGDMIDATSEASIRAAAKAFDLPVPVYLCLGNHDLTTRDAAAQWMALAPGFFIGGQPDFTIETGDGLIHVAPNQWTGEPFFWEFDQQPHLTACQHERLSQALRTRTDMPHLLLTHCPVFGLPEEQTGFKEPFHDPGPAFSKEITSLAAKHPNLRCVLSAHNHLNMHVSHAGVEYVTVSSLVESPFEFKLFEITSSYISMTTGRLGDRVGFSYDYDEAKSFVQGRPVDRSFTHTLVPPPSMR